GAMIPIWIIVFNKVVDLKIYLIINIISTLSMGVFDSYISWAIFRFVAGVSSGTVLLLASNVALEEVRMVRSGCISGLLYSGVGLVIFTISIFIFYLLQLIHGNRLGFCSVFFH